MPNEKEEKPKIQSCNPVCVCVGWGVLVLCHSAGMSLGHWVRYLQGFKTSFRVIAAFDCVSVYACACWYICVSVDSRFGSCSQDERGWNVSREHTASQTAIQSCLRLCQQPRQNQDRDRYVDQSMKHVTFSNVFFPFINGTTVWPIIPFYQTLVLVQWHMLYRRPQRLLSFA